MVEDAPEPCPSNPAERDGVASNRVRSTPEGRADPAESQHLHASICRLEGSKSRYGFWRGKQDILRHSYGTHRMAIIRSAHQVAEEMGNSVAIVRRHYDAVLEPSKAIVWWEIQPKESGNVVPMKAVA